MQGSAFPVAGMGDVLVERLFWHSHDDHEMLCVRRVQGSPFENLTQARWVNNVG